MNQLCNATFCSNDLYVGQFPLVVIRFNNRTLFSWRIKIESSSASLLMECWNVNSMSSLINRNFFPIIDSMKWVRRVDFVLLFAFNKLEKLSDMFRHWNVSFGNRLKYWKQVLLNSRERNFFINLNFATPQLISERSQWFNYKDSLLFAHYDDAREFEAQARLESCCWPFKCYELHFFELVAIVEHLDDFSLSLKCS